MGNNLANIIDSKKISESSDLEIRQELGKICSIAGITNLPSGVDNTFLVELIQKHLGKYALGELVLAFELAISPNSQFNCDLKHFNTLSYEYIVRILKAYTSFKKGWIDRNRPKKARAALPQGDVDRREVEAVNFYINRAKEGKIIFIPSSVYDFLTTKGIRVLPTGRTIEYYISLSKKEKVRQKQDKAGLSGKVDFKENMEENYLGQGKKLALLDYFKRMAKANKLLKFEELC